MSMSKDGTRPLAGQMGQDNDPYGIATPTDSQRLDWLQSRLNETLGFDDLAFAWDYEDGFFIREIPRGDIRQMGEVISGQAKTITLRAAIDAAIAAAPGRADD